MTSRVVPARDECEKMAKRLGRPLTVLEQMRVFAIYETCATTPMSCTLDKQQAVNIRETSLLRYYRKLKRGDNE